MGDWLSPDELKICRYAHLSYEEMGGKLGMNPRTVKARTDALRIKLGVRNKRHIQEKCRQLGINFDVV